MKILEKDGNGTVQTTSLFVWSGMTIAEQRSSSNTVIKRFLAEGVQFPTGTSPNTKLFYSKDHLGSIRSLSNENGTMLGTVDYDAYGGISRAPVPANDASGSGPVLTSAVSRLTHSFAGTFDVNLALSGAPGIEMRRGATTGAYQVVLTFDRNVLSDTSTTLAAGVGSVSTTTFSGNTATVSLSGVADRQTITIELDNVVGAVGVNAKVLVSMSLCIGDVTQSGTVTQDDINAIKAQSGNAVTSSTFKYDLNHDGFIDAIDTSLDKSVNGDSLFPDFAFTGHYYHARSGLYFAPYRAYNPTIGRWLSRDPIGERGGLHLYAYVSNDPITFLDPLGLRYYNCCETKKLLARAYADSTSGPISGLLKLRYNSTNDFDFKVQPPVDGTPNTFCVDGRTFSAAEFGNYIAGFGGGAYDKIYAPATSIAGVGVLAAGLYYHVWDSIFHINHFLAHDPLDLTGGPFIDVGRLASFAYTNSPASNDGCECNH